MLFCYIAMLYCIIQSVCLKNELKLNTLLNLIVESSWSLQSELNYIL